MLGVIRERDTENHKSTARKRGSAAVSSSNIVETVSEDNLGDTPRELTRIGNYKTQRFELSP